MKKKALRSKRNRHTGVVNSYKQSIIDNSKAVILNGYAVVTTFKTHGGLFSPTRYSTEQVVRL